MNRHLACLLAVVLALALNGPLGAQDPPGKEGQPELNAARRAAWEIVQVLVEKVEAFDLKEWPGLRAWLKDFRKATRGVDPKVAPERWPALDADALASRNPNFWRAYFEIAPADPGLMVLHAGLLLSAGEATRASHLLLVARQRPGLPAAVREGFDILLAHVQKAAAKPNALVYQGIKLHDEGDYAGALKKYREALALWPQNGFAHYEIGLSLYAQECVAAGEKVPKGEAVIVNGGRKPSPAVAAAYAKARRHDPFQVRAYQGDDQQVIRGLLALVKTGMPAWDKVTGSGGKQVASDVLQQLAAACQEADIHELALAVRQVLVARRGRYLPADHPLLAASLRKLAPGPQSEEVLKKLAGEKLTVRELIPPERPKAEETPGVDLHQLRLYVPGPELPKRVGDDVEPLANYIKALQKAAATVLAKEELPKAKGLLIAVGIKPGKKSRVWCQAVEGEVPEGVLRKLEKELAKVAPVAVKNGAMAFGMEMKLRGQEVRQFPEFPAVWVEAARRSRTKLLVPPDELFKVIWPD